jgi:hypothetical protein
MRIFRTRRYQRDLKRLKLTATEAASIELAVVENPTAGDVIPGLRGLRKLRFAMRDKGKRGGGRVVYFLLTTEGAAVMMFAYAKSVKEDLSSEERKYAVWLMEHWENETPEQDD